MARPDTGTALTPKASVIIPCRNEVAFIAQCIESVCSNECEGPIEVIVADGGSTDGTLDVLRDCQAVWPNIWIVDNPAGSTPAGLNQAILAASGPVIIRVDAHARVERDYITKCLKALASSGADNVGGLMYTHARSEGVWARAIAHCLSHRFGVGNSTFRVHTHEDRWVDTVFGGCYRRDVFDRIGLFNERLSRGQDMEFNRRLVAAGGRILLVPQIVSHYSARSDLRSFCRHNWSNGIWAILPFLYSEVMPVSWRHLVPLTFVSTLLAALLLSLALPVAMWLTLGILAAYATAALLAAAQIAKRERRLSALALMPVTFALLHFGYGLGSLWAIAKLPFMPDAWRWLDARAGRSGIKRGVDIVLSAALLTMTSIPILGIAALVKLHDGGPVFYGGVRAGLGGRRFRMWKFRTMIVDADRQGSSSTADDDGRITGVGRWLRQSKLDELPQLWNVLNGEMSFVGPRPQVAWAVDRYTNEEQILLTVRPGITDPASLRFANEGEILRGQPDPDKAYFELIHPEKMRLSIAYVKSRTLSGDFKILFATLASITGRRRAISTPQEGHIPQ